MSYTFNTAFAKLYIELGRGDITVTATETDTTTVTVAGDHPEQVAVTQEGDEIRVVGPKFNQLFGIGASKGHSITATVPVGSQLQTKTGSADVTGRGPLRAVWVKTGSGDISVETVQGPANVVTGSGDIAVGRVEEELSAKTGSGDVTAETVGGTASVATGSGDVTIGQAGKEITVKSGSGDLTVGVATAGVVLTTGSGDLRVKRAVRGSIRATGASADVRVGVVDGTPVWTDVHTVTGSIKSTLAPVGQPAEGQDHVELTVRTVSGDVYLENV